MQKKNLDFIEKKFIFRISRGFIWVLVSIVAIGLIGSFLFLIYSLIPPIHKKVSKPELPPEPVVTLAEVDSILSPPKKKEKRGLLPERKKELTKKGKEEEEKKPAEPDTLQPILEAKIDKLGSYFPDEKYQWKTQYRKVVVARDAWGNPTKWSTRVSRYGLNRYVYKVIENYDSKQKQINEVEKMLSMIPEIEEEKRGEALRVYTNLKERKIRNRKKRIKQIEREYEKATAEAIARYGQSVADKAQKRTQALMAFGGSFVSIAILGLFLVFLAIERNTRAVQELINK